MKVKVRTEQGDIYFDSSVTPVAVLLTEDERAKAEKLSPGDALASFPLSMQRMDAIRFLTDWGNRRITLLGEKLAKRATKDLPVPNTVKHGFSLRQG